MLGCGSRIRTCDLVVMSHASYPCSIPQCVAGFPATNAKQIILNYRIPLSVIGFKTNISYANMQQLFLNGLIVRLIIFFVGK